MEILSCAAFWITSILIILSALLTIFTNKISLSLFYGFITFFLFSFLYFLLNSPFNGAIQIVIYGVTISLLFAFAIMLTNHKKDEKQYIFISPRLLFTIAGLLLIIHSVLRILLKDNDMGLNYLMINNTNSLPDSVSTINILGTTLFTQYIFGFEILSVLLLTGVIGIFIIITKNKKTEETENE